MAQSSPTSAEETTSDDFESYRRFREITLYLMPVGESGIAFDRSGLARIREALSGKAAQRRRLRAGYISLLAHLGQPEHLRYAPQALAGISLLKGDDLDTAQRLFDEIQERVIKPSPLFYLMRGASIFALVLSLAVLVLVVPIGLGGRVSINSDSVRIFVGFIAGGMGGFTSIMNRLDHFVALVDRPRDYLTWTGFALPIVGGMLGMFSAMLLLSNLLNVSIGEAADTRSASVILYFLIAFIAGYSERFSKSLVKLAEGYFGGRDTSS